MQAPSRLIGETLVDRRVLSRDVVAELLSEEQAGGISLVRALRERDLVGEKDLLAAVAFQAGFEFVDLSLTPVSNVAVAMLSAAIAREYDVVPVALQASSLLVAMVDPSNTDACVAIEEAAGMAISAALADRGEIGKALLQIYGAPAPEEKPISKAMPNGIDAQRDHASVNGVDTASSTNPFGPTAETASANRPNLKNITDFEPEGELHLNELLEKLCERGGSDLHLSSGAHPTIRVDGQLIAMTEYPVLNASEIRRMVYAVLTQKQRERFEEDLELDLSHSVAKLGRFRMNVLVQRDAVGAVMRAIPFEVTPLENLGLPNSVGSLADVARGLVLVTGPTGSGKSTTLASLVDKINAARPVHIMTVEDPIEFLHQHKRALINQREVGEDTKSFAKALRHVLRQDPDVILVGEMRDLETIATALTAAETGHLVFGTLHTQDAPQSVDRIIDVFPAAQQTQIRVQLASALQGIVTQQLVPFSASKGRAVAAEVLIATPAVRNLIREGKTHQMYSAMQAGGQFGMQTMDMSLAGLVRKGAISMQSALDRCMHPDDLRRLVHGVA